MARKTYPDSTLVDRCRTAGTVVTLLWEIEGPANTNVAWLSCYLVNGLPVIVETFKVGGWMEFTTSNLLDTDNTVRDVLRRVGFHAEVAS